MKKTFITELIVVILLFGIYAVAASPSQPQYNGREIALDSSGNETPRAYIMKIYVGDDKSDDEIHFALLQNELKPVYSVSSGETDGIKEFVSDMTGASEPDSPRSGKFLRNFISSLLESTLSTDSLDLGSILNFGNSGGLGDGSGISSIASMIQTFSGVVSMFSNVLSIL